MSDDGFVRTFKDAILVSWARQRTYGANLVEDIPEREMASQPVPGVVMNHAAWVLAHLNVYMPVLCTMLRGGAPEDPLDHPFGQKSKPLADAAAYGPKTRLVGEYLRLHDETVAALEGASVQLLSRPTPIERFLPRFPTIAACVVQLMIKHENTHLGQLSAWRRAGKRPSVGIG